MTSYRPRSSYKSCLFCCFYSVCNNDNRRNNATLRQSASYGAVPRVGHDQTEAMTTTRFGNNGRAASSSDSSPTSDYGDSVEIGNLAIIIILLSFSLRRYCVQLYRAYCLSFVAILPDACTDLVGCFIITPQFTARPRSGVAATTREAD